MSHVRSSPAGLPAPPPPPDTAEGFAVMTYEQRCDLHARNVELYRQLASEAKSKASREVYR